MNHSQRLNEPQLKPWVALREDGMVLGAHCNCMAGLGEACSHIGSVLFYLLEQCAKKESSPSVTSIKCKWSQPSRESLRRVEYEEGRNIVFNHSQKVKRVKLADSNISHGIQPLSQDETRHLYDKLSTCTSHDNKPLKPGILSVVRGHAQNFIPQTVELNLPDPLTALYSAENRELTPQQIQEKADETFSNISITNEQVKLSLIIV